MTEYLSCADTAKLIRAQLKAKFPGIDVKNAAEALTVFAAYVEEAKATGKLAACSLRAGDGRKAPGFDKAKATLPPYTIVNDGAPANA